LATLNMLTIGGLDGRVAAFVRAIVE
jgi:hypothetical protein